MGFPAPIHLFIMGFPYDPYGFPGITGDIRWHPVTSGDIPWHPAPPRGPPEGFPEMLQHGVDHQLGEDLVVSSGSLSGLSETAAIWDKCHPWWIGGFWWIMVDYGGLWWIMVDYGGLVVLETGNHGANSWMSMDFLEMLWTSSGHEFIGRKEIGSPHPARWSA